MKNIYLIMAYIILGTQSFFAINIDYKANFNSCGSINNINAATNSYTSNGMIISAGYDQFVCGGISGEYDGYLPLWQDYITQVKSASVTKIASYDISADLTGKNNYGISFWYRLFTNGDNNPNTGIFMSDDGGVTFEKILSITDHSTFWHPVQIDLDEILSEFNLTLNSYNIIRFQYSCDYTNLGEGIAIDNIIFAEQECNNNQIIINNVLNPEHGGDFENGWYGTSSDITISNTIIKQNTSAKLYGGNGVTLNPGFECNLGATFIVSNDYNCGISFKSKQFQNSDLETTDNLAIEISPNPTRGSFKIKSNKILVNALLNISNSSRNLVYSSIINGSETYVSNLNLINGIYIISVQTDNKIITKKIMVY